jgi:hypothetical protein
VIHTPRDSHYRTPKSRWAAGNPAPPGVFKQLGLARERTKNWRDGEAAVLFDAILIPILIAWGRRGWPVEPCQRLLRPRDPVSRAARGLDPLKQWRVLHEPGMRTAYGEEVDTRFRAILIAFQYQIQPAELSLPEALTRCRAGPQHGPCEISRLLQRS